MSKPPKCRVSAPRRTSGRCRASPFTPFANFPTPAPRCSAPAPTAASPRRICRCSWAASMPPSSIIHGQVTPNLLIVETRLSGQAALDELDRLAEVCDPATKVIVVGRANDVELYRELMRRGASEYLVRPGRAAAADRSDFRPLSGSRRHARSAGSWPLSAPAAAPALPPLRTMSAGASPRNCTSTPPSSISTCPSAPWAWTSTTKPARAWPMRCRAPERLDDVLLDRLLLKRGDHLSLFTAPAALERDYDAAPEAYEAVIDAVRQTTPCVMLDMPHVWAPWIKAALLGRRRNRDRGDARPGQSCATPRTSSSWSRTPGPTTRRRAW